MGRSIQDYLLGYRSFPSVFRGIDRFPCILRRIDRFQVYLGGIYVFLGIDYNCCQKVNTSELQIVVKSDLGVLQWDSLNCIRIAPGPLTRIPYLRRFSFRTIFKESNKEIIWK